MDENIERYRDIMNEGRPASKKHRPMSAEARAAQFAPFAALTGYEDVVRESGEEHLQAGDGVELISVEEAESAGDFLEEI